MNGILSLAGCAVGQTLHQSLLLHDEVCLSFYVRRFLSGCLTL
jgi:hypothetical protein